MRKWAASQLLVIAALVLMPYTLRGQAPAAIATLVQSAKKAHGNTDVVDMSAEGTLTVIARNGHRDTFPMFLLRKGTTQIQREILDRGGDVRQGTNGATNWMSFRNEKSVATPTRAIVHFLESQTVRSVQRLMNYQAEGLKLRDLGPKDKARVVESEDVKGVKTRYYIDSTTSVVSQMEFEAETAKDAISGKVITFNDIYVFSDYRVVQGVLTPFLIVRYSNTVPIEEMRFSAVRYNTGLLDTAFHP